MYTLNNFLIKHLTFTLSLPIFIVFIFGAYIYFAIPLPQDTLKESVINSYYTYGINSGDCLSSHIDHIGNRHITTYNLNKFQWMCNSAEQKKTQTLNKQLNAIKLSKMLICYSKQHSPKCFQADISI